GWLRGHLEGLADEDEVPRLRRQRDRLPRLDLRARDVVPPAVDRDVAVGDQLAGLAGGEREAETQAHRVQARLELADHLLAGHGPAPVGTLVVAAHLLLVDAVDVAELLLLEQSCLVLRDPLAAAAVLSRRIGSLVGRAVGTPAEGRADAPAGPVLGAVLIHAVGQATRGSKAVTWADAYPRPVDGGTRRRAVGAIVGAAIGDALGAPFGSLRRDAVPSPLPAFERSRPGDAPGTGTDATAMARNLWGSLIANDGALVLSDVLARHLAWLATGPGDVGAQTRLALEEARRGTPEAPRVVFERRGPGVSAGNGSVMYCGALGVARARDPERLFDEAPALSALTHWDER